MSAPVKLVVELEWETNLLYASKVQGERRTLGFAVQFLLLPPRKRGAWHALAIETGVLQGVEAVFNDHSHESLGSFRTPELAQKACAKYAREWTKRQQAQGKLAQQASQGKLAQVQACPCGPIQKKARKAA